MIAPSKYNVWDQAYDCNAKPRPDVLKQHFLQEGRLEEEVALRIINEGTEILKQENTMLTIEALVTGTVW